MEPKIYFFTLLILMMSAMYLL